MRDDTGRVFRMKRSARALRYHIAGNGKSDDLIPGNVHVIDGKFHSQFVYK